MCKYNILAWEWIEVKIVRLMEVSAMFYKHTYCVFTLYVRAQKTYKKQVASNASWHSQELFRKQCFKQIT